MTLEQAYEKALAESAERHEKRMKLLRMLESKHCTLADFLAVMSGFESLRDADLDDHYLGWLRELMNEQHKFQ